MLVVISMVVLVVLQIHSSISSIDEISGGLSGVKHFKCFSIGAEVI